MKDPIQGALDAVREVEIRVRQVRLLWSEAERARESAQAEAHSLSVELARLRKETVRKDEEWRRGYEELRNRGDFELNTIRAELVRRETELGAVKDADWTLIASLRAELEQAELRSATADLYGEIRKADDVERFRARAEQELKRLRRSNEQVREVLGANHGESPVEAAERAVLSRQNKEYMGREIERLRAEREKERAERTGVEGVLRKRYEDREAVVAEKLAGLLGNVNLACYGVDDLIERLRDELSTIDWMGSAKRMAGG